MNYLLNWILIDWGDLSLLIGPQPRAPDGSVGTAPNGRNYSNTPTKVPSEVSGRVVVTSLCASPMKQRLPQTQYKD